MTRNAFIIGILFLALSAIGCLPVRQIVRPSGAANAHATTRGVS